MEKQIIRKPKYNDSSITTKDFVSWCLLRPLNQIPDTDVRGQFHVIKEICDNSIDELSLTGGNLDIYMFLDKKKHIYQTAIIDHNGSRGIPVNKLSDVFTNMMTSGKFNRDSYTYSAGQNGLGAKASRAFSEKFLAVTKYEGSTGKFLYIRDQPVSCDIYQSNYKQYENGTMVLLEPRHGYFTNVDTYIEEGYTQLVKLMQLISIFSKNISISIKVIYKSINDEVWDLHPDDIWHYIQDKYDSTALTIFDGTDYETVIKDLKSDWGIDCPFIWTLEDIYKAYEPIHNDIKRDLGYAINIYLPKSLRSTYCTMIANNVPLKDNTSSPLVALLQALKNKISPYIENIEHKDYFINIYRLPVAIAMSIQYGDLQFSDLVKSGFKNSTFEKELLKHLTLQFDGYDEVVWKKLYSYIADDIELKYNVYFNKPITNKKNSRRLTAEVGTAYYDCSTSDRSKAELFIVEGLSANHIVESRDPSFQAIYMVYGKPMNSYRSANKKGKSSVEAIKNDKMYSDLSRILNIQPGQTDLSIANFSKIILTNDADIDGGHIRTLNIGNINNINPLIIPSGMLYLANPPLYEVRIGSDKKAKTIYVRSKKQLTDFKIDCLYRPALNIKIENKLHPGKYISLQGDEYSDFCHVITDLGEQFEDLSKRLAIPTLTIEKLTHITHMIQPNKVRVPELIESFGRGTKYNEKLNILTVISGEDDISFPLDDICQSLYETIMPDLHNLYWKNINIYISTPLTKVLNNTQVCITQLYDIFLTLNSKINVLRQKGLGGMNPSVLKETCVDPNTRLLDHITSIGDLDHIESLLGDDVTSRKKILQQYGTE